MTPEAFISIHHTQTHKDYNTAEYHAKFTRMCLHNCTSGTIPRLGLQRKTIIINLQSTQKSLHILILQMYKTAVYIQKR